MKTAKELREMADNLEREERKDGFRDDLKDKLCKKSLDSGVMRILPSKLDENPLNNKIECPFPHDQKKIFHVSLVNEKNQPMSLFLSEKSFNNLKDKIEELTGESYKNTTLILKGIQNAESANNE